MKKAILILIPLIIALTVRLYPTLISGMPFSTDAWPLIRNTQLLLQNTPVPLGSGIFDGYNNYWPANQIFGAMLSQITSTPIITAMSLGIPIAAALAIPIFYLLVKKLTENNTVSLIATALLATAFPYALFTAGVTKETFASPIYISLILIFLLKHTWKTTILFSVISVALVMAHHLTAFLAVAIMASLTIASFISKKNEYEAVNSYKSNLLYLGILSGLTAVYFVFYASPAFLFTLTASDLLAVGAYNTLLIGVVVYFVLRLKKPSRLKTFVSQILALAVAATLLGVLLLTNIVPGAPIIPSFYILYALPFFIAVPTMTIALNRTYQKNRALVFPLIWLTTIVAFAAYAIFASPPGGVGFAYRALDFIIPPLMILVAIGAYTLYSNSKRVNTYGLTKVVAAILIFSMMALSAYTVYATVSLQEPYLGYFWRYQPTEYQASEWVTSVYQNQTVTADVKVTYLLNGYFNESVDVMGGLRYLEGNGSAPDVLYIYNQMYKNGYVLYEGSPVSLPQNWTDQLANYNCVYANPEVTIYAKR
jgi:hypothetical protein